MTDLGFVYFVEAVGLGAIKIGFTHEVERRLSQLSSGCPGEVRLLLAVRGDRYVEREMHDRFAAHHVRGEWFKLSVATIRQLTMMAVELFEFEVIAAAPPARAIAMLDSIVSLFDRWTEMDHRTLH